VSYRDPDSGLDFASYDVYERERRGSFEPQQPEPTDEQLCAAGGHVYHGDLDGRGRCYCGERDYPATGQIPF
jgi:hypothetical protein